jgi:DNA-binding response OmpR family regulator
MATVLIIDDDEQIRGLLKETLASDGFQVFEASDGRAGLQQFQRVPANVVFVDLVMPEKEGLETIRELRRLAPGVKLIAMSGGIGAYGSSGMLEVASKLGADLVFEKPFDIFRIGETVRRLEGGCVGEGSGA